ncbi:MAG: sigma 54-interacting transcriptional regulator [Planctomycetota bacterium]|nr:sigma 54-interacting transcriptional regulator [Planctomycetota bacterium]
MNRILVIDDDAGNRLIVKSRLSDLGHEVITTETGASGLMEVRSAPLDLVLVAATIDTGISSVDICRRLKAMPESAQVPILLYSNQAPNPEEMSRAFEAGCNGFVNKAEMPVLDQIVKVHLKHKATVAELVEQNQMLDQQYRRLRDGQEKPTGKTETVESMEGETRALLREMATGKVDGLLLVDADGFVRHCDRGACEFFGSRAEGKNLGSLAPATGLEAFVRDSRTEMREGFRFDLTPLGGRSARCLLAAVIPLVSDSTMSTGALAGLKVVLLRDAERRRLAAGFLGINDTMPHRLQLGPLLDAAREMYAMETLVGQSDATKAVRRAVSGACKVNDPILLSGPDGAGKTHVARTIHYNSQVTGSLIEANCAGMDPESIERELFGLRKGGLEEPGLIHYAADGTLFLEEMGALPKEVQIRLREAVETGRTHRKGTEVAEDFRTRLICGTSRSLQELVRSGELRKDFAEMLKGSEISLQSLSERSQDVVPLAIRFISRYGPIHGVHEITDEALGFLDCYSWPGNVGELESTMRASCMKATEGTLGIESLPQVVREAAGELPAHDLVPMARKEPAPTHSVLPGAAVGSAGALLRHPRQNAWDISLEDPISLDHYEMKCLLRALDDVEGDKLAAARLLRVGKSTLYRKLKRFGIR